jgi:hypothetical protein
VYGKKSLDSRSLQEPGQQRQLPQYSRDIKWSQDSKYGAVNSGNNRELLQLTGLTEKRYEI